MRSIGMTVWVFAAVMFLAAGCSCGDDDDDNDAGDDDVDDDSDDDADDDADDDSDDDVDDDGDDDTLDDDVDDDTDDDADDDTADDDTDDDVDDDADDDVDDDADDDTADDDFVEDDCNQPLEDPFDPGSHTATLYEYGHDADPDKRTTTVTQYFWFADPYVTLVRGIHMNAVPLHALGHVPDGAGPFPLVLIVHGNHTPSELSYPGYQYLTEQLATHGFIAFSVEEDFLNGGSGEMDARGIVLLRHLQLFREWNQTPAHALYGKIDMDHIGLAGHSRGGEAVGVAWLFNTTKHDAGDPLHNFQFKIRSLYAIAPVDGQLMFTTITPRDVNYFIMHGSHDGDVSDFQGHDTYDRALPPDEPTTRDKGLLFVQGANHSGWNTVWAANPAEYPVLYSNIPQMTPAEQQAIGQDFITAWFRWTLMGRRCYRHMAAGEIEFPSFPTGYPMNRQFQSRDRYFLDHYQEDTDKTTGSAAGVTNTGTSLAVWNDTAASLGSSRIAELGWTSAGSYLVDLAQAIDEDMDTLAFRVGQTYEATDNYNVFDDPQDFQVRLVVDGSPTGTLKVSDYRTLVYPCRVDLGWDNSKTLLDTVRIPLEDFAGPIDTTQVDAVEFLFAETPSGLVELDDIQFTNW